MCHPAFLHLLRTNSTVDINPAVLSIDSCTIQIIIMMNNHQHQEQYYDQTIARPAILHRPQPQNLHRQSSRQFDAYGGPLPNALYRPNDHAFRYESGAFPGMNSGIPQAGFTYEHPSAQTWNSNAFTASGGFPAFSATERKPSTRGRAGIPPVSVLRRWGNIGHRQLTGPQTWLDQQQIPGMNFGGIGPSPLGGHQLRHENFPAEPDEELIPTAIVIKNIPFAVKKEQLVDLMTQMNLPLPYAFNYHFDNGVFRGLAFANFTSSEETAMVIQHLNHYELQSRKLRVEYKKMLPLQERERIEREKRERRGQLEEQHRPMASSTQLHNQPSMSSVSSHVPAASPSPVTVWNAAHGRTSDRPWGILLTQYGAGMDLNDPSTLDLYSKVLLFRDDASRETLIFPPTLTPQQRRCVHTLAHHMQLAHISRGQGEQRQVHVHKSAINLSPPIPQVAAIQSVDPSRRALNRAATIDFNEARSADPGSYNTLRGQQSSGFLGVPDSPSGFGAAQNLRAAKSFADLRSYTPSPVPSTASFPATLQSNIARFQDYGPGSGSSTTPTLTSAISGQHRDDNILANGLGNMTLNGNLGAGGPHGGSPRRIRSMFSWDMETAPPLQPQQSVGGPIGSNRSFSVNYDDQSRDRGQAMPLRQPRGPTTERGTGFSRGRQNGHQGRGSDELRSPSNVEIIVE